MKPRAIIADDHTMLMEGLKSLLAEHVDLVAVAEDGRALIDQALRWKPDLILLDISMPELNGVEAARRLRQYLPDTKLIFVTMHADPLYAEEALRMGVSGYVLKRSAVSELVTAIQAVQEGRTYVSPLLQPPAGGMSARGPRRSDLTPRQREVLQLVAEGRSAKEIATALNISMKTAQFHKANLTRKLGLHTTAELVKYAVRRGITEG